MIVPATRRAAVPTIHGRLSEGPLTQRLDTTSAASYGAIVVRVDAHIVKLFYAAAAIGIATEHHGLPSISVRPVCGKHADMRGFSVKQRRLC